MTAADPPGGGDTDGFDLTNTAAVVAAMQSMREIITAEVVHKSPGQVRVLIGEYVQVHGRYLVYAGVTFIRDHATDRMVPELAEDRFHYLLTRIGNLISVRARRDGVDEETLLLSLLAGLGDVSTEVAESEATTIRAAQTCLVAHSLVRRGRSPWGIQRGLDRNDMLVLNETLGKVLIVAACDSAPVHWADVVEVLLQEVHHLLGAQARAASMSIDDLVADYFMALAARDASTA